MTTVLQLPADFRDDLEKLRLETERFKSGALSAAEYRAFRVPRGVYEQRESDTYMLRARCPGGIVLPQQMRALARVARRYGDGILHVTTRQDIQVHRVLIDDIAPALVELFTAGLSTKGGGGNTVRNITGCCDAGVCAQEAFDVSPHLIALTEALLPDPLSYQLPRKYKIAFSGCSADCAGATVNDLGLVAKTHLGTKGFAVYIGGGLGADSHVGVLLEEFVPAEQVFVIAEAIKRVFDQHGNRKNRKKARIRFLVERLGLEGFRELYRRELLALQGAPVPTVRTIARHQATPLAAPAAARAEFDAWKQAHAVPQAQDGYCLVQVPLALGEIDADTLEALAEVIEKHGERMARGTQSQNLVLRWVHASELPELHGRLLDLGLGTPQPAVLRNLVACTGASTCKLGICLSRGLARTVRRSLEASDLDLAALGKLQIHISGCPNSCGRHPLADIGLFGAARRVGGTLAPHYVLQVGGCVGVGVARLAQGTLPVPARNVPMLIVDFLRAFQTSAEFPDYQAFLADGGRRTASALAVKYQEIPPLAEAPQYYYDWEAETPFSLAGRGPGECGAGVFDLIEVDLAGAEEALQNRWYFDAVVLGSRALLVTQGQQAQDERQSLELFHRHFVVERLVGPTAGGLVARAQQALKAGQITTFQPAPAEVADFVAAIKSLYESMDASLRFKPAEASEPVAAVPPTVAPLPMVPVAREVDFRGVVCPLNYVKTTLVLNQLKRGDVLAVVLDEPGKNNVPGSVEKDGHTVLGIEQQEDRWRLLIRKS